MLKIANAMLNATETAIMYEALVWCLGNQITQEGFLELMKERRPDLVTAHFVDWIPIDKHILGDVDVDIRFVHGHTHDSDTLALAAAVAALAEQDPDITFFYFHDLDGAGHAHGFHPTVPAYRAELEQIDGQLGELLAAVRAALA